MSIRKGITTWIVRIGKLTIAYRHNMGLIQATRTFRVMRGQHVAVACGPLLAEW